jgi:hypothetical protein
VGSLVSGECGEAVGTLSLVDTGMRPFASAPVSRSSAAKWHNYMRVRHPTPDATRTLAAIGNFRTDHKLAPDDIPTRTNLTTCWRQILPHRAVALFCVVSSHLGSARYRGNPQF